MRRLSLVLVLVLTVGTAAPLAAAASAEKKSVTARQLRKAFKRATGGDALRRDPRSSWRGVDGLRYGGQYPSYAQIGKYGRFLVYVVRPRDRAEVVASLLDDIHTAEPIAPNKKGIRWESNYSLRDGQYWTAKKRYGANVVTIWNGTSKKRVDATWNRLSRAMRKAMALS